MSARLVVLGVSAPLLFSTAYGQTAPATTSAKSGALSELIGSLGPNAPAIIAVIGTIGTAVAALIGVWIQTSRQRSRELEVARSNAEFKQVEAVVAYRSRQMENFYAPMHAYLCQSRALYRKLNKQLVIEFPDDYAEGPETYTGQILLLKQDGEKKKAFRLLDKMPDIHKSKLSWPIVEQIVAIGVKMETIITKHAGLAAMDHTDTIALSPTDIVNPLSLAYKLRHSADNALSAYLWDHLSAATRTLVQTSVEGSQFELQLAFTRDLNVLLRSGESIYDVRRFEKVTFNKDEKLDLDIRSMLAGKASGDQLVRQNRYALEAAFPDEISTKNIVDLLGEYLAHIAVLKQLLAQCQKKEDLPAYPAGWHVMGYYPRSLNAKIEAGYGELTSFLAQYSDRATKILSTFGSPPPSVFDRMERIIYHLAPRQSTPVI